MYARQPACQGCGCDLFVFQIVIVELSLSSRGVELLAILFRVFPTTNGKMGGYVPNFSSGGER
jgi:hypothetical protein